MAENIQGVDLSTGKLYIPLTLASISGPNGFGETFGIQYSTLGLSPLIRTWNQDAPTGVLGLGWSLTTPSVIRLGNGSIYDTFLLNGQKLILTSITSDQNGNTLSFVTAINSQLKIQYETGFDRWVVIDGDGITYTYGLNFYNGNIDAVQYGVNWQNSNGEGPTLWVGDTIQSDPTNQKTYTRIWNLSSKSNTYGQQVNYTYSKDSRIIGAHGLGLSYDVASYLSRISVEGGQSIELLYQEKEPLEYPLPRFNYETDGSITNAYQDRIETKYLASAQVFNELGQLQNNIIFNYGFLWDNYNNLSPSNSLDLQAMNKRVLTSITVTTPDGYEVSPAHTFDYWGYGSQEENDGFQPYFISPNFHIKKMLNGDLDGSNFPKEYSLKPFQDASGNTYNQLFGHLKTIQSPEGALTWYSYAEVSQNYKEIGTDFDTQWDNKLDLKNIIPPIVEGITWTCPRPFWGPDGYVVIRWYSETKDSNGKYKMCIVVYEWLGKWVPVLQPEDYQLFDIYSWQADPMKDYQVIETGVGFFCLVIASSEFPSENTSVDPGYIYLFNRDPNQPGQWKVTEYPIESGLFLGKFYADIPSNILSNSRHIQVSISNNIVSVLDREAGSFYGFAWDGQNWQEKKADSIELKVSSYDRLFSMTCSIQGSNVLIISTAFKEYQIVNYFIYNFNPANLSSGLWSLYAGQLENISFVAQDKQQFIASLDSFLGNNFISINALVANYSVTNHIYHISDAFYAPLIISWDDNFQVNCQCIEQNGTWAFPHNKFWRHLAPWQGSGNFSQIGDNSYYTTSKEKIAFRYIASPDDTMDSNGNIGWESQMFTNSASNDSYWGNLALPDLTIAAQGSANITFNFYQYDPTSQSWVPANNVGQSLGSKTDYQQIITIVTYSIEVAGLLLTAAAPIASTIARGLGFILNLFSAPLTTLTGLLIGTEANIYVLNATMSVAANVINSILQTGEGFFENYLLNNLLKRSMDNYSNGSIGNFILSGQRYTTPSLFYNQWISSNTLGSYGFYEWVNIDTPDPNKVLYLVSPETESQDDGLAKDSFILGNYCVPYGYAYYTKSSGKHYFLSTDQALFFNNGQVILSTCMPTTAIPSQYKKAYDNFKVYKKIDNSPVDYVSYQINSHEETNDNYGYPLLTAPWGGILGFLGSFVAKPIKHYQQNIDQALEFGLFMAKDEKLEGPVQDFVINKVSTSDGYQTNNTFFQFMPQFAAYNRAINSINYNQIRVAQGSDSYINSAQQFGWKEYYFYNGGLNYTGSPYNHKPGIGPYNKGLPYDPSDPANYNDQFTGQNSNQSNAGQYYSLMTGQTYCVRTLISQDSSDHLNGYEVARTQTFYYGFNKNICDPNSGSQLSVQQVVGVVPTLTVTYSSPSVTTYADITEALSNNCATLNYSYTFYDYPNLYGPWVPTTAVSNENRYCLWLPVENEDGDTTILLNTVLPLGTLTYTYSLLNNITKLNATYTQSFPSFTAYVQAGNDQNNPYSSFVADNLYNVRVQSMTWQLSNVTPPTSFATPNTTWGNGWELTSSQVTTWASTQGLWHPNSSYMWQGNANGTPQTTQFYFPWATPPTNSADSVWVQGDSVYQINGISTEQPSSNGVVLSTTNSLGIPTFSIYDQQFVKKIATFTNAGLLGGNSFYCGFESFENLSAWTLRYITPQSGIVPYTFSPLSYIGNRSLNLLPENPSLYYLCYKPSKIDLTDPREYILSITLYSSTSSKINISISVNEGINNDYLGGEQNIQLDTSWTTVYIPCKSLSNSSLDSNSSICILLDFTEGSIFVDNISFMPATEASFAINSYDSASNQLIATASLNDRSFSTRYLYDNLNRSLGVVRKGSQPNEMDVLKLAVPYYSLFGNDNSFNANDPNALLTLTAGLNSSAGYYFDFRDGQNPWNGGTVSDRLLTLNQGESATFALPQDVSYGFGIQVQLQGYLQNYTTTLSNSSFPAGSTITILGQPALGVEYPNSNSCFIGICSYNSDFYGYNMYFDENSFTSKVFDNPLITNTNPIINSPSNQWLLANGFESDGSVGLFGVFESETDEGSIYSLYHFSITDNQTYIVSTSNAGLIYFPFFSQNNSIYFADVTNGIYSVDTSNISNSPATFKIETIVEYSDLVLPATDVYNCTAQPIVGGANNSTLWFPIQLPDVQANETYICMYDTTSGINGSVLVADTITLSLGADSNNNVYAVGANTLYAYDASLYQIGQVTLPSTPNGFSQPIVGNGIVAVALDNGILCLYTSSLELIAQINVDDQIVAVPVMNGDKISVGGYNTEKNQYTVYTYNTAGLLATTPYVTSATSSLNIAAYYNGLPLPVTPSSSALNLTIDGTQFSQITLGVPSTTLNMGSYSVSWDSDTNQFSLTGPNITVDSVTVAGTQGNWLFVLVNPYLYFYADGQQIFAVPLELDALPTGNFTITAGDDALSCRDIVLINDPSLQISYHDGANKVRQVQHMADVVLPQQSNQGV